MALRRTMHLDARHRAPLPQGACPWCHISFTNITGTCKQTLGEWAVDWPGPWLYWRRHKCHGCSQFFYTGVPLHRLIPDKPVAAVIMPSWFGKSHQLLVREWQQWRISDRVRAASAWDVPEPRYWELVSPFNEPDPNEPIEPVDPIPDELAEPPPPTQDDIDRINAYALGLPPRRRQAGATLSEGFEEWEKWHRLLDRRLAVTQHLDANKTDK